MNKAFRTRIAHGTLLVLNFELLLVLNHNDVTWDCPKRERFGEEEIFFNS
jgi:hypothetical protein